MGPSSLQILSARGKRFSSVEETEEVDDVWGAHNAPLLLCLKEHWEFFILAWLPPLPLLSPPFPSQQPSGLPPPSQLVYAQKIQTHFHVS